ncbi:hypothetical protein NKR23_g9608 [Pleurostoma richardsiae]|uniref:Uncharacterized protein n=1 Tax=Pleurostoma richardsiae TaxID=41990 RepID=A0AA38VMS6_9PEZI|nr:hypothetical protein NKR23_g9608 [Pleurostoma richardsiae]
MIGTFIGLCVSVLITFVNPYMQNEGYGGLKGRVGFIYGSFSFLAVMWCFFLLPETGKRSLEELDDLFYSKVPAWKFSSYQTSGFGAQLAGVEAAAANCGDAKTVIMEARADEGSVVDGGEQNTKAYNRETSTWVLGPLVILKNLPKSSVLS